MVDIIFPRLLLVMYDLESSLHTEMRRLVATEFGPERSRWTRVQQSIIVVKTSMAPAAFKDLFDIYVGAGGGKVFIVDITDSGDTGYGDKAVWDWIARARKECQSAREVHSDAYLEQEIQRKYGAYFASKRKSAEE